MKQCEGLLHRLKKDFDYEESDFCVRHMDAFSQCVC